jgi:hypothetical protein
VIVQKRNIIVAALIKAEKMLMYNATFSGEGAAMANNLVTSI